jgi:carbon-monoxide dehydrogenase iron sulfur subunit
VKRIVVHPEVCSGCRACEVACVAYHEGRFGTASARIHVLKIEPLGIDKPQACRQCRRAPCIQACPTGALYKDPQSQAVLVNDELCNSCGDCIQACPFNAIRFHPDTGLPNICDLCSGDPQCVSNCATGALTYRESSAVKNPLRHIEPDSGGRELGSTQQELGDE